MLLCAILEDRGRVMVDYRDKSCFQSLAAKRQAVFDSMNKIDNKSVAPWRLAVALIGVRMNWGVRHLAREFGRLVRFGITGVMATVVYAAVTIILVERCGVRAIAAAIIGYLAASGVSYFGHLHFSFSVEPDHRTYFWRFLIASSLSFVLNVAITWIVTGVLGYSERISVIIASILIPTTNYLCNRFWVFLPGLRLVEADAVSRSAVVKNTSDPA
jgi:putative flippase GtrA